MPAQCRIESFTNRQDICDGLCREEVDRLDAGEMVPANMIR